MIVLKDICKKLERKNILNNISFHIGPDERVGLIGLNGAGKTTLLNIISGILKPDSGFIRINGAENVIEHRNVLRNMAYVSGTRSQLWEDLQIKGSFDNCIQMYQIDKKNAEKRMQRLNEVFELERLLAARPKNLSLGERIRCELAYALLAEPRILMLDEAMIGLDVSMKYKIMEYFEEYRQEKKPTMIFTSHNLLEVEKLCDRVILLDKGNVIFDGSIERIMREFAPPYHLEVRTEGNLPDFEDLPLEKFTFNKGVFHIVFDKRKIETVHILKHMLARCQIKDAKLYEPDLEGTIQKICQKGGFNGTDN